MSPSTAVSSGCRTKKSAAAVENPRSRAAAGARSGSSTAPPASRTRSRATRASLGVGRIGQHGFGRGAHDRMHRSRRRRRVHTAVTGVAQPASTLRAMALSTEADYVLHTIEERGIRFVRLWFTDVLGFLKSFTITSQELEGALRRGDGLRRLLDRGVQPDPGVGHGGRPRRRHVPGHPVEAGGAGRADVLRRLQPRRHALRRRPPRRPQAPAQARGGPGLHVLRGARARVLLLQERATIPTFLDHGGYFDETPLDVATDYRKRTVQYLEAMGIPVEYVHHEVAPSQHEIDLRYTDALTMADNVMTYRLTVKEVAQEFGIYATFMPKPVAGVNGSGMHTHQSLFDGRPQRVLRRRRRVPPVEDGEVLHRRPAAPRARDHPGHQPVGELVQAAGPRLRGARLRLLGAAQPQRAGPRADVQAGQGGAPRGSSTAHPTPRATPTSRSPRCWRRASPASRATTSCRPRPATTSTR